VCRAEHRCRSFRPLIVGPAIGEATIWIMSDRPWMTVSISLDFPWNAPRRIGHPPLAAIGPTVALDAGATPAARPLNA
jgi:hypothetical protein